MRCIQMFCVLVLLFASASWCRVINITQPCKFRVKRIVREKFLKTSDLHIIPVKRKPPTKTAKKGIQINLSAYTRITNMKPTFYYTEEEKNYNCRNLSDIIDVSGRRIGKCREGFMKAILQQGSGRLVDGRTVNIISRGRFKILPGSCPGITKTGYHVIPFHTLAVNPKVMPYGSIYYIPRTKGLKLPDGSRHDGFWFAHDTGSAFKGKHNRMDMYVHNRAGRKFLEKQGLKSHHPLKIYQVDPDTASKVVRKYSKQLKKGI